jgi:hypothetical protein
MRGSFFKTNSSMTERAISLFRPILNERRAPFFIRFQTWFGLQWSSHAASLTVTAKRPGSGSVATAATRFSRCRVFLLVVVVVVTHAPRHSHTHFD